MFGRCNGQGGLMVADLFLTSFRGVKSSLLKASSVMETKSGMRQWCTWFSLKGMQGRCCKLLCMTLLGRQKNWAEETKGEYTVKSAYKLFMDNILDSTGLYVDGHLEFEGSSKFVEISFLLVPDFKGKVLNVLLLASCVMLVLRTSPTCVGRNWALPIVWFL